MYFTKRQLQRMEKRLGVIKEEIGAMQKAIHGELALYGKFERPKRRAYT